MPAADPVALYSDRRFAFFGIMFTRFLRAHMRALRVAKWGVPQPPADAPLIVLANHPSWWDGVAFLLLRRALLPERRMFIPMEAAALARYPFMTRIGVFGVEPGSRGAIGFLRTAEHVLAAPTHMLWMNAPGRFSDPRERPVPLAAGVVRLSELAPNAWVMPLALEYPFWNERAPEMLAAFGPPIAAAELNALGRDARAARLSAAIAETADRLAADAIAREPSRFVTLEAGQEGMGGLYGRWRRLRATLRGETYDPRHDPSAELR